MYLPHILPSLSDNVITNFADVHSADIPACHLGHFLFVGTHQGDIEEVLILLDLGEGSGDVGMEVIPSQAKLLRGHC